MTLRIGRAAVEAIRRHGETGYPDEVCGFLIGYEDGVGRRVERVLDAPNTFDGSRRTRFLIHPREVLELERSLEGASEMLLGFYHTHPDHPSRPSDYDCSHAWPWYSYVVLSVNSGRAVQMTSWRLKDDRSAFDEEPMEIA